MTPTTPVPPPPPPPPGSVTALLRLRHGIVKATSRFTPTRLATHIKGEFSRLQLIQYIGSCGGDIGRRSPSSLARWVPNVFTRGKSVPSKEKAARKSRSLPKDPSSSEEGDVVEDSLQSQLRRADSSSTCSTCWS